MEIVTISQNNRDQYVGKIVTREDVEGLYQHDLPGNIHALVRTFEAFSYIGDTMYRECSTQEEADQYMKQEPLFKFAGYTEAAYVRFGLQYSQGRLVRLSRQDIYIFHSLTKWVRKSLLLPTVEQPHLIALMYPVFFQDRRRGFLIERSAYAILLERCQYIGGMLNSVNGTMVVVV